MYNNPTTHQKFNLIVSLQVQKLIRMKTFESLKKMLNKLEKWKTPRNLQQKCQKTFEQTMQEVLGILDYCLLE